MATHSSVLAWRIPEMAEPGGLPSMGSHRVGHDWSDLAAVAGIYMVKLLSSKFFFLSSSRNRWPSSQSLCTWASWNENKKCRVLFILHCPQMNRSSASERQGSQRLQPASFSGVYTQAPFSPGLAFVTIVLSILITHYYSLSHFFLSGTWQIREAKFTRVKYF